MHVNVRERLHNNDQVHKGHSKVPILPEHAWKEARKKDESLK